MKVKQLDINSITPYERNAKKHPQKQIDQIAESLKKFGWQQPIVIDKNGVIVIGHGRYAAAQQLHMKKVPCTVAEELTDDEIKMLRLADNKLNESDWDFDLLAEELDGLDFGELNLDFDLPAAYTEQTETQNSEGLEDEEESYRYTRFWENCEKRIYEGVGKYDIPEIEGMQEIGELGECIGFNYVLSEKNPQDKSVHFFVDDYQFYRLWANPDAYMEKLRQFRYVFTPDFSPYGNFPMAVQIWNHYRKHWIGAYMQENGVNVIPTITWSHPPSYDYCFDGEPKNSVIAMSSVGCMSSKSGRKVLIDGFKVMLERLHPSCIIFYGQRPQECQAENIIDIKPYQSKWDKKVV